MFWRGRKTVLRGPGLPQPFPGVISRFQRNGEEGLKALSCTFIFEPEGVWGAAVLLDHFRENFRRWTTASQVEDSHAGESELSHQGEGVYEVHKAR